MWTPARKVAGLVRPPPLLFSLTSTDASMESQIKVVKTVIDWFGGLVNSGRQKFA